MPISGLETVVVKEFHTEQAGELVGWVNVIKTEESELVMAAIAYARIGENGAIYSYETNGEPGDKHFWTDDVKGFEYSTDLEISGKDDTVLHLQPVKSPGIDLYRRSKPEKESGFANNFYDKFGEPSEVGTWAMGRANIINAIKHQLDENGARWMYPAIYYNLAQIAVLDLQLADPDMHRQTTKEVFETGRYETNMEHIVAADEVMSNDLTIFGHVKPEDIPNRFAESRRHVRNIEKDAQQHREAIVLGKWLMGLGDVIDWPYMDPTVDDEKRAFGLELEALKSKNVGNVQHALNREILAARKRSEVAGSVQHKLAMLKNKENDLWLKREGLVKND